RRPNEIACYAGIALAHAPSAVRFPSTRKNASTRVTNQVGGWVPSRVSAATRSTSDIRTHATHRKRPRPDARHQPHRSAHDENAWVFRARRVSQDDEGVAAQGERVFR